ncbi:RHS repeat-associated core domain-containing protein, partial [Chryseobacterium flavum]
LDENNYYPFGLKHEGVNVLAGNPAYQYKYNGKELQESGMYDYGARMYMADLGRWGVHDPLSELQFAYSPYSYVYGNPIRFNDPTGMIGEEDPPKKGSTPDNPIDIGEIKLTKNVSDSKLSFMGIQSLNAYHGSQDRLAFGIRNSKAALATEKFEKNLAQGMITFGMGGSNLLASAGWTAFDTYLSYQDDDTQEAVGTIQLMAMLIQVSHGNTNGIQKFVNVDASRINIAKGITRFTPLRLSGEPVSAGWKHVLEGHFNRPLGNNRSVFSTTEEQLKNILQSKTVINSPLTPLTGGQFQRTVDTGQIIGNASLKQGGAATSWINVITDYKGNLITTYPIAP